MTDRTKLTGLILAAGKGTRMKSDLPKGLHEVCGVPMVGHIVRALKLAGVERPVVVVGYGADQMKESLGDSNDYVLQSEQLGTGHAASQAAELLKDREGAVVVVPGDTPLLSSDTIAELASHHQETGAAITMATCLVEDPTGYGRILRKDEDVTGIVEHKDCTDDQLEINEINPAIYCFDCKLLFEILPTLSNKNAQGEYYLTDVIKKVADQGGKIQALVFDDDFEFLGVNDRWQLAEAAMSMNFQILEHHATNGVTFSDPGSTNIGAEVEIEPDVTVLPGCLIEGKTTIGAGSQIGPNCWIKSSTIGSNCKVFMSHLESASMKSGSRCGPFSNLRPGTDLSENVKIGNFVEVKNSILGEKVSASHLAYIGDTEVGEGTNIGAGTITCNYDGYSKHRTVIGAKAFVGSNTTLIAPVEIGDGAIVAAGSVITDGVPADALALGRSRQENKEQWAKSWRKRKTEKS